MSTPWPRVIISYVCNTEQPYGAFRYTVAGSIPIGQLVGFIVRIQAELAFRCPEPCSNSECIILYDPETCQMSWFVDSCIPVDPLVGMLEFIKYQLIESQMSAAAQSSILAPNGQPISRRQ